MSDRLTIQDCRAAGYCVSGVKRRCDELGLDFRTFVREGFLIVDVESIDDHAVKRSLEKARERLGEGA